MLADLPHNDLDTHIRDIHALNDYFLTAPVEHFDEQENRHLVSKSSALAGALTFPTRHVLKAPLEGLYYSGTSTNDMFTDIHPGAGQVDGDTELDV